MFNSAHVHLLTNHVPVMAALIGLLLLLVALLRRSAEMTRAGMIVMVLAALAAVPAYLTGDPAEHIVNNLPGVQRSDIHEHEESAQYALVAVELTGLLALFGLARYWSAAVLPRGFVAALLFLALLTSAIMARTAYLGGMVRHTEIRPAAPEQRGGLGD
ncbi:MAG TPA: hypothetical protein VHI13_07560 [Candidatus Kapabacteria bacterium]|nr:hypothetical protein [Candidatus Kapabacteria bacterium]